MIDLNTAAWLKEADFAMDVLTELLMDLRRSGHLVGDVNVSGPGGPVIKARNAIADRLCGGPVEP